MRSHGDLTGLIKFLARDDWKSSFEEVLGEHFGPAMQEFDLEYEAIGAALHSGSLVLAAGGMEPTAVGSIYSIPGSSARSRRRHGLTRSGATIAGIRTGKEVRRPDNYWLMTASLKPLPICPIFDLTDLRTVTRPQPAILAGIYGIENAHAITASPAKRRTRRRKRIIAISSHSAGAGFSFQALHHADAAADDMRGFDDARSDREEIADVLLFDVGQHRSTEALTLAAGASEASLDALDDHRALEFAEHAQHLKHGAAGRSAGIQPLNVQIKVNILGVHLAEKGDEVLQASAKAID